MELTRLLGSDFLIDPRFGDVLSKSLSEVFFKTMEIELVA